MGRTEVQNLETRFECKSYPTLTVWLWASQQPFEFQCSHLCNDKTYSQAYCQDELVNVCKIAL